MNTTDLLMLLLLLLLGFLWLRYLSPLVVTWHRITPGSLPPKREEGCAASFIVFAAADREIPSNQWRLLETGVEFSQPPLPGLSLKKWGYGAVKLQGQVMLRVSTPQPMRGIHVYPRLVPTPAGQGVVLYNDNQTYTQRIRRGDPIALVEITRVPFVFVRGSRKNSRVTS